MNSNENAIINVAFRECTFKNLGNKAFYEIEADNLNFDNNIFEIIGNSLYDNVKFVTVNINKYLLYT